MSQTVAAMTKTKGGRDMNPADAQRKAERKKEVQRNKLERKFMREASSQKETPDSIKKQLQEVRHAPDACSMR